MGLPLGASKGSSCGITVVVSKPKVVNCTITAITMAFKLTQENCKEFLILKSFEL